MRLISSAWRVQVRHQHLQRQQRYQFDTPLTPRATRRWPMAQTRSIRPLASAPAIPSTRLPRRPATRAPKPTRRRRSRQVIPHSGGVLPQQGRDARQRGRAHRRDTQDGPDGTKRARSRRPTRSRGDGEIRRVPPAQLRLVAPAPTALTSPFRQVSRFPSSPSPPSPSTALEPSPRHGIPVLPLALCTIRRRPRRALFARPSPPSLRRRHRPASRPGTLSSCRLL
ncbi:hypothetical protein QBC39DRAFT_150274 [Podospora conica]|nr:hypothetical protein QBC39DRAFT_150274 [Schizothecium conicum]